MKITIQWKSFAACHRRGQTLVESAIAIMIVSLILFGMLQVAVAYQAEQVQKWAIFAAARARVVGFNDGVVHKAWAVANILNCGAMEAPTPGLTELQQSALEDQAIPLFFQTAGTVSELSPQLDYTDWETLQALPAAGAGDLYTADIQQDFPLRIASLFPFLSASFGGTNLVLRTPVSLENHFPYYLDAP